MTERSNLFQILAKNFLGHKTKNWRFYTKTASPHLFVGHERKMSVICRVCFLPPPLPVTLGSKWQVTKPLSLCRQFLWFTVLVTFLGHLLGSLIRSFFLSHYLGSFDSFHLCFMHTFLWSRLFWSLVWNVESVSNNDLENDPKVGHAITSETTVLTLPVMTQESWHSKWT